MSRIASFFSGFTYPSRRRNRRAKRGGIIFHRLPNEFVKFSRGSLHQSEERGAKDMRLLYLWSPPLQFLREGLEFLVQNRVDPVTI